MNTLNQTCEVRREAIQELLGNGILLMDTAEEVSLALLEDAKTLEAIYAGIPDEVKLPSFLESVQVMKQAIMDVRSQDMSFTGMKDKLVYGLGKLLDELPVYDTKLAEKMEEAIDMTRNCTQLVESLKGMIPLGMDGNYGAMGMVLAQCKEKIEEVGGEFLETMKYYEMALKGIEFCSTFSRDPVNLNTGNFIYDKEDISVKGCYPLFFSRFYNAINERAGSLGPDWNHNYEVSIEINEKKNSVSVVLADGREDIYKKSADGIYVPFRFCGSFLEKTNEGFLYTNSEQIRYLFDAEGRNIRQENLSGEGITFTYELKEAAMKPWRLSRAEEDSGNILFYTYNGHGYLETVTDQSGRSIGFTYQDGRLHTVVNLLGGITAYTYGRNGKIESVTSPREITTVTNQYDYKGRTVKQIFPDGSEMGYEYRDKERTVILTEQNGNRIHYIHDEQKRHSKTVYTDEAGNPISEESYEYNSKNCKTKHIDRNGNRTRFKYDGRGNIIEVIDSLRQRTCFLYNAQNRIIQVKQPDGSLYKYIYDEKGNLLRTTDPLGQEQVIRYENNLPAEVCRPDGSTVRLRYDDKGNLSEIIDECGYSSYYRYDALNRVIQSIDPNGNSTGYAYNAAGDIETVTNAEGNTRTYQYNQSRKVVRITDFDGSVTESDYNEISKISSFTDPCGNKIFFSYDKMQNLAERTDPGGGITVFDYNHLNRLECITDAKGASVGFAYDANGNRIRMTGPEGQEIHYTYDVMNRIASVMDEGGAVTAYEYDALGRVTSVTDPLGARKETEYDLLGRKIKETDAAGSSAVYTYTPLGRIRTVTDAAGRTTAYEYRKGGLLSQVHYPDGNTETYTYDRNRNLIRRENSGGYALQYTYDSLNRITRIESSEGQKQVFTYDAAGNIISLTDANGNITHYTYNPSRKLTSVTDACGNRTEYEYDGMGALIALRQYGDSQETVPLSHDGLSGRELKEADELNALQREVHVTRYERDIIGQVIRMTDASGNQEEYRYSPSGRMIEKTDRDGYHTAYTYTPAGDLRSVVYADGKEALYDYDPLRRLIRMQDWLGTTAIVRDMTGQIEHITDHADQTVSYEWGSLGERRGITYPDGRKVEYRYDDAMRLSEMTAEGHLVRYHYDPYGRLAEKELPNGIRSFYRYRADGQLEEMSHSQGEKLLERCRYQYDFMGNRTDMEKYRDGLEEESGTYRYGYDPLNRLTGVSKDGIQLRSYTFDAFGNRKTMEAGGETVRYHYNALNQLIREEDEGTAKDYRYDRRGNLTAITSGEILIHRYEIGPINRMEKAWDQEGRQAAYLYNGLGNRVGRQEHDRNNPLYESVYLLDQTRQYHNLLQKNENGCIQNYLWDSQAAMLEQDGEIQYYIHDELGSPLRIMDESGNIAATYGYDEYGNEIYDMEKPDKYSRQGVLQPFGYTGYRHDNISSTYFAQAREYRSGTGRFAAEDLNGGYCVKTKTLNKYGYCYNQPLQYVDLDGKTALDIAAAILFPVPYTMYRQIKSYANLVEDAKAKYNQERIDVPAPVFPTDPTGLPDYTEVIDEWLLGKEEMLHETMDTLREIDPHSDLTGAYFAAAVGFYYQVKDDGEMDIKRERRWKDAFGFQIPEYFVYRGEIMDPGTLGNITFGYVGASLFPSEMLYIGAGVVQVKKWGWMYALSIPFLPDYGDAPEDRLAVEKGINMWLEDNRCGE